MSMARPKQKKNQINDWNGLTMTEMTNANEIVFSVPDESYKIGYIM